MAMMEPVFADAAIDHLGSRDVLQTTAVNAHNIMTLYWHAGCLLSVMRKHLNLFLLKTFAKMFTHATLMPVDCAGINTIS
jgi:hypothetical protein